MRESNFTYLFYQLSPFENHLHGRSVHLPLAAPAPWPSPAGKKKKKEELSLILSTLCSPVLHPGGMTPQAGLYTGFTSIQSKPYLTLNMVFKVRIKMNSSITALIEDWEAA